MLPIPIVAGFMLASCFVGLWVGYAIGRWRQSKRLYDQIMSEHKKGTN